MLRELKLKELRENNFWSQQKVANLLKIKRRTYAEYELRNNMVPIAILVKLAIIYHVSVDYICGLSKKCSPYGVFIPYDENTLRNNIKSLRKEHRLTQKALGLILSYSQNTISEYEKGIRSIPLDFLISLANFYHISLDQILGIVDIPITN